MTWTNHQLIATHNSLLLSPGIYSQWFPPYVLTMNRTEYTRPIRREWKTGIPTDNLMNGKSIPDLQAWEANCRHLIVTYMEHDPMTPFWEELAELMKEKADTIATHLCKRTERPQEPIRVYTSQSSAPSPFRITKEELNDNRFVPLNQGAWGRHGCPIPVGEKWDQSKPLTPPLSPPEELISTMPSSPSLKRKHSDDSLLEPDSRTLSPDLELLSEISSVRRSSRIAQKKMKTTVNV